VSLELQESKIRAQAEVKDAELAEVIVDAGESAKSLNRPGMVRLLELVDRRAVGAVIVYKLDRLTRNVGDLAVLLERFERCGVSLVSVSESLDTESAAGRLVLNVMAAVAQWEREAIGERTREALAAKRERFERIGTVPYGYKVADDGRTLEEQPEEQRILDQIITLRRRGLSLRQMAAELNRNGYRTRSGAAWRHQYVANTLKPAAAWREARLKRGALKAAA
jgi:DNA invertase Pin-like site-specific DNA recombinase